MSNFNRKSYMAQVHAQAKRERALYENLTGERGRYSDFLKGESPLDESVIAYEVSFQMTYSSPDNNFSIISPQTFNVYALKTDMVEENIMTNTIESLKNMKGKSGAGLNQGLQNVVERNTNVDLREITIPRGLEPSQSAVFTAEKIQKVKEQGIFVETLDNNINVEGGRRKKTNQVDMKADLKRYIE